MNAIPSRRRKHALSTPRVPVRPCLSLARTATESAASVRGESYGSTPTDFVQQPGTPEPNVAVNRRRGHVECSGDLVIGQAAEVEQLDDLGQSRFHLLKTLEGVIEGDDVKVYRRQILSRFFGKHLPGAGIALHA